MASKQRLDQLLVARGLAATRSRAQALITGGHVLVGGASCSKPSTHIAEDAELTLQGEGCPYVSRGGLKLAHALEHFGVDVAGLSALDVGASTGGFTDVLLRHGAHKVFAVDVGHGQLDATLISDPRVVCLEKTNARELTREVISDRVDVIVCDVSFISLKKVLPAALALAGQGAQLITLIKPQFEVGKKEVGKGVVRDASLHAAVCDDMQAWISDDMGWHVQGLTQSPITGPKGNVEFLLYATK